MKQFIRLSGGCNMPPYYTKVTIVHIVNFYIHDKHNPVLLNAQPDYLKLQEHCLACFKQSELLHSK